jgi:hypothetical protein
MPKGIERAHQAMQRDDVSARQVQEAARNRYQTRNAEVQSERAGHAKEVRDTYQFSPEAKAKAVDMFKNQQPTTSANTGIDMGAKPAFSERSGVSFGGKG